jgi:hypothetical protein
VNNNKMIDQKKRIYKTGCLAAITAACLLALVPEARSNLLRVQTLGNQRIALVDEDNQVNPYDMGRNPACLLDDFELSWTRFKIGGDRMSGDVLRPFDAGDQKLLYGAAAGRKRLGERHAIVGGFTYEGQWRNGVYRSIERDPYNDSFYLTDLTEGDFEAYGPSATVDYALQISKRWCIGAGIDYALSTALKQQYTRPEIVHNNLRINMGLAWKPVSRLVLGAWARPQRIQNRTEFAPDETGTDNIIHRYSGAGIYEIRSFSSYSIREVMEGIETGVQTFLMTDRLQIGATITYELNENDIRYGSTRREHEGFWQQTRYGAEIVSRYTPQGSPLTVGLRARVLRDDAWAKRPEYDDVLLFDNPVDMESVGGGVTLRLPGTGLLMSTEYILNHYDVTVEDHGARQYRRADVVQNVARLGVEYDLWDLHSIRAGAEAIDFLIDRQLIMPPNTDRYRFSAGFRYRTGYWDIESQVTYERYTQDVLGLERDGVGVIVWFSHI